MKCGTKILNDSHNRRKLSNFEFAKKKKRATIDSLELKYPILIQLFFVDMIKLFNW